MAQVGCSNIPKRTSWLIYKASAAKISIEYARGE